MSDLRFYFSYGMGKPCGNNQWIAAVLGLLFLAVKTSATVHYVDVNGAAPAPPYTSWLTAATNIQHAIDVASANDQILVTNGVYQTGGRSVSGSLTNRVAITKPVTVQSVNGPAVTVIRGYQVPGTTNGVSAIRCVYLTNGAALIGFTLTNGATSGHGGGLYCESTNAFASDCVITGNSASGYGGGTYSGTLSNCVIKGNSAGFYGGGGSYGSILNNCLITQNAPGGTAYGILNGCVVSLNTANGPGSDYGSGVSYGIQNNCTIVSNTGYGAGAYYAQLNNCIVYYNHGNYSGDCYNSQLNHCCTIPQFLNYPFGNGSFTNAPLFVDLAGGDLRLQSNSPCINAGENVFASSGTDLDGNPRVKGGAVDVGAFEFQAPTSTISYVWLQQFGLPMDGSADLIDSDGDGMSNRAEWRTRTDPTDPSSLLKLVSPVFYSWGVMVSWPGSDGVTYFLQRSTNLLAQPAFTTIQSNITSQYQWINYGDVPPAGVPVFYRVGVQ